MEIGGGAIVWLLVSLIITAIYWSSVKNKNDGEFAELNAFFSHFIIIAVITAIASIVLGLTAFFLFG